MSEKFDSGLNLALETDETTRELSDELNGAFDAGERLWEVIVKYYGNLEALRERGIGVEYLMGDYAILSVPENEMDYLGSVPEIEYVELPRRFFYQVEDVREAACFYPLITGSNPLTGEGVLMAVLDSGIDLRNPEFLEENGNTKIVYLWDQESGREYSQEELNDLLRQEGADLPGEDISGHGTAVAGIGAGRLTGLAPGAGLLIVKLGSEGRDGFPMTTQIMRGVDRVIRKGLELGRPLVVNLSFGNTYGPHDGSGLLARYLDTVIGTGRNVICVGTGNEGDTQGHCSERIRLRERSIIQFAVADYESNLSVQIWQNYADEFQFTLISPTGIKIPLLSAVQGGKYEAIAENTRLLVYFGNPTPYSVKKEVYIEMVPMDGGFINSGLWEIEVVGEKVVSGLIELYLPSSEARGQNTRFLQPTPEGSLTIPSTAGRVISVGGYNNIYESVASFSGRGFEAGDSALLSYAKPDIAAPGVNIPAPSIYGGMRAVTGTSFATPIVSAAAALLMEQGIVRREDIYMYGEKVKAVLQNRANSLPGINIYPNPQIGWGTLCVSG